MYLIGKLFFMKINALAIQNKHILAMLRSWIFVNNLDDALFVPSNIQFSEKKWSMAVYRITQLYSLSQKI